MADGATLTSACGLDSRDVDLLHRHHRVHRALGGGGVRIGYRLNQYARRDLPAQSELVLAPAAHAFLAAAADDRIPVAVGLLLRVGEHLERDRLVEGEFGSAVQADEALTKNREIHRQHIAG